MDPINLMWFPAGVSDPRLKSFLGSLATSHCFVNDFLTDWKLDGQHFLLVFVNPSDPTDGATVEFKQILMIFKGYPLRT